MQNVKFAAREWATCVLFFVVAALAGLPAFAAIGTAFTYQGRIALAGTTVTGALNFEFELYDSAVGGASVGGPLALPGVITSDGLFTVPLDFGAAAFQGDRRWLEIRVGTPLTTLTPRQELTPTPYAIYATDAANAVSATNAINATNAVNATTAVFATNAGHALTADNATNATNAVNATTATTAGNALLLGGVPPAGYSLVGHTHPGTAITGISPKAVVFGSAGGTLTDDGANFSYESTTKDLTVGRDLNLTSGTAVYRIASNAVLRVAPAADNTFVGLAGNATVTGTTNTAVGDGALAVANTNSGNTAVGANALKATLSLGGGNDGNSNTAIGNNAMVANTTGFANTAVGVSALAGNLTGFVNTAIGAGALAVNTGNANVAVGVQALTANTTGGNNTAVGTSALLSNTSGGSNSAFGQTALNFNTTGSGNTAIGSAAMLNNTTAGQNTAVGASAMSANTAGGGNTAVGAFSLAANQLGLNNTALGSTALQLTTSSNNTAVGAGALKSVSIGDLNVGLGLDAGSTITTGTKNIIIGASAGFLMSPADNNNIVIGHPGGPGDVGKIRIGATLTHVDTRIAGINNTLIAGPALGVVVNGNGQLGTGVISSMRFKEDVRDMSAAPDQLLALRPVTFRYRPDVAPEGDPRAAQYGLIAEEVAQVNPDWAIRDGDGTIISVRYDQVNAALLSLAQRQQAQIDALTQQMSALAARMERLQAAAKR